MQRNYTIHEQSSNEKFADKILNHKNENNFILAGSKIVKVPKELSQCGILLSAIFDEMQKQYGPYDAASVIIEAINLLDVK